jgi:GTP-binding protein EngB required for normal cell division
MPDVIELLDTVDLAVARASGVVSDEVVDRASLRTDQLRKRRGFQGKTLVLALAGGTGTGKSSLLNAIAGSAVASVSSLRPHTDRPLAWIPAPRSPGLEELLDDLGITDRVSQSRRPGLALIDLPDMDSVAAWHRRTVEDLLPRVDGVVWVFDPAKYRDPTLHAGFLRPMAEYRDQFVFVLNKVDTLTASGREAVAADLRTALEDDGYHDPLLFTTAAAPVSGSPSGVDELESYLGGQMDLKRVAVGKWLIDLSRELRALGDEAGVWAGASIDFNERWLRDRNAAAVGVVPGFGSGSRSDAVCRIEDLIAMVAVEVGPLVGDRIRDRFPEGTVEEVLEAAARESQRRAGEVRRKKKALEAAVEAAAVVLDTEIGEPIRDLLGDRAAFGATLLEAAVGAAELRVELAGATAG